MSEVDRLSNSGIFPALPIADKRGSKDPSGGRQPPGKPAAGDNQPAAAKPATKPGSGPDSGRNPKSIIDEYA